MHLRAAICLHQLCAGAVVELPPAIECFREPSRRALAAMSSANASRSTAQGAAAGVSSASMLSRMRRIDCAERAVSSGSANASAMSF